MRERTRTTPNLLESSPSHAEAVKNKEDHYRMWERNVADQFKDMPSEQIKEHLQKTSHPFAVCFEHWIGDFNLGTGIRNANAFNASRVFYLGDKKWDKRSAVGVHNYTEVEWIPHLSDLMELMSEYNFVGIDNVAGSVPLSSYRWQPKTLMIFGEEGVGLTPVVQSMCKDIVAIEMFGSVRSLNCGVASGIVMHDFVRQLK